MSKSSNLGPLDLPCELWPHASRSSTGQALHVWLSSGRRHTKLMARVIWEICTGRPLSAKEVVVMTCHEPMCVFIGHMRLESRKEVALRRAKRQVLADCPASVAKLPAEKRVMLTICVVNNIGTNARLARRFGVTPYQVRTIRDFVRKEQAANAAADAAQQVSKERVDEQRHHGRGDVGRAGA